MDLALIAQVLVLGVLLGGQLALFASGLTLYYGVMKVVMLAHAAFLTLAAYFAWYFQTRTGIDPLLSLFISVPLFFAMGILIQRHLVSRLRPATLTMMSTLLTLGIAMLIEGLLGFAFSGVQRRINVGYGSASISLLGVSVPAVKLVAFGLAVVTLGALYLILMKSTFGRALRATVQHPEAARLVGIDTDKVTSYGFGLALATAAIGGTALSLDATIYPSMHWLWLGPLMAVIVVGGMGSIPGAAIAAMLLGIAQSVLQIPMGATWAQTIFYIALFATFMFRPQGFFGGQLAQRY